LKKQNIKKEQPIRRELPKREVVIPPVSDFRRQLKKHLSRSVEKHDLGRRYTAKQEFFREVLAVEEGVTPKIDEALSQDDFGKVGAYLRAFYLEVCKRIDQAKYEIADTSPKE
jgi:hypothetical protein